MNESTTPPSNDNNYATSASISTEPPSIGPEQQGRRSSRSTAANSNSRRRINIQTAAPSESASPAPAATMPSNVEEDDPFDALINEFDRLDLEEADGGDSDVEGEEFEVFDEAYVRAMMERNADDSQVHVEEIQSGDIAFVIADKGVLDTESQMHMYMDEKRMERKRKSLKSVHTSHGTTIFQVKKYSTMLEIKDLVS